MSVSSSEQYESMKSAQTEMSSASAFRIVLTKNFICFLAQHYKDVAPYYFATYEHQMHDYGVDLLDVSEEDAKLIWEYYKVYFKHDNKS